MIFLVTDLIQYIFGFSHYSKSNIEKAGGVTASEQNININNLEIGDMIFFHPRV